MSTFTSRLNLELPVPSESMKLGDNILSANYQKIDAAMGSTVDSGIPSAPFPGEIWSARDVDETTRYYNAGWNLLGSKSIQKGFKAFDLDATTRQSKNAITNIVSVSFNAVLGRSYQIDWSTFYKWQQPARGFISFLFFNVQAASYMHRRRFDWLAGTVQDYGQTFGGFWIYDEVTVTRDIQLMLRLDTTETPGLTAEMGALGAETSLLVTDCGAA